LKTVLLMGLRGSGKSTCGEALAGELNRPFVDLDRVTLERLGASSVREAWDSRGEPAFREAEIEALRAAISEHEGAIIALGGGTPTVEGFEEASGEAVRVYLHATPRMLASRIEDDDADRPALNGESSVEEMGEVYAVRDSGYRALAHKVVEAQGTVEETLARLRSLA